MKKYFAAAFASAALVVGMFVGPAATTAQAMPALSTLPAQTSNLDSNVIKVQRRRRGRRIRNGVAIGIGAAILGGIIASQARPVYRDPPRAYYRPRPRASWRARKKRCARNFRSFDWRSGTIVGYDGIERRCPYL